MARITDRGRIEGYGDTPSRMNTTGNRRNVSEIDILRIDDREAKKTLNDFYRVAKEGAKSTSDEIRKMWILSTEYSSRYKDRELENIEEIRKEREKAHQDELSRIKREYNMSLDKDKALEAWRKSVSNESKRYNMERIALQKEQNRLDANSLDIENKKRELLKKYGNKGIGKEIARAEELKIQIENDYKNANSGTLTDDEIKRIADHTDDLENQLAEANKKIERSISTRETIISGVKSALVNFLKNGFDILTHNYKEGVLEYFNAYESTFTEFAGRLGASYDDTRKFYVDITNTFKDQGEKTQQALNIQQNIIPAVQTALQKGFRDNDAIAKAIADEQSKILMPWLDTQSDAWINMSFNMKEQTMDLLRSQQLQLQTSKAGNRLLQSGVVNNLTEEMEPLLRDIEYNTGGNALNGNAEAIAYMKELVDKGYTPQEAYRQTTEILKDWQHPFEAVTSGQAARVLRGSVFGTGGDFSDAVDIIKPLTEAMASSDPFGIGAMAQAWGFSFSADTKANAKILNDAGKNLDKSAAEIQKGLENGKTYEDYLNEIDGFVSETKQKQNKQYNDVAEIGQLITSIAEGDRWLNAILDMGEAILAAILAGFGGDVLTKALKYIGLGEGGKGILNALAGKGASDVATAGADAATSAGNGFFTLVKNKFTEWSSGFNNLVGGTTGLWSQWGPALDYLSNYTTIGRWATGKGSWSEVVDEFNNTVNQVGDQISLLSNEGLNLFMTPEKSLEAIDDFEGIDKEKALYEELYDYLKNNGGYGPNSNNDILLKSYAESMGLTPKDAKMVAKNILDYTSEFGRGSADLGDSFFNTIDLGGIYNKDYTNDSDQKYKDALDLLTKKYFEIYYRHSHDNGYKNPTQIYEYKFTNEEKDELSNYGISDTGLTKEDLESIIPVIYDLAESGNWSNYHKTYGMTDDFWSSEYGKRILNNSGLVSEPVNSYDIGSAFIPHDQLAYLHKGERVFTADENSELINKVLAINTDPYTALTSGDITKILFGSRMNDQESDNDISREDMTDTLLDGLNKIKDAISELSRNKNGIDYNTRTLPRMTNNYNDKLINLSPVITAQ